MVHEFVDDDGTDERVAIAGAGAGAELLDGRGIIDAEGMTAQGREEIGAGGRMEAAKGDGAERGVKVDGGGETGKVASGVGGGKEDLVAGGVEGEAKHQVRVQLVLVEDLEAAGEDSGVIRDAKFPRFSKGVAEEPAADVDGLSRRVEQFDGIFEWAIGVSQDLVDEDG